MRHSSTPTWAATPTPAASHSSRELGRLLVLQRSWTRVAYGEFLFRGMALNCSTMTTGRAIARPTGAQ
jgi:hypothetical protein